MKFLFFLFTMMVACLLNSSLFAVAPIGPAASTLEPGQAELGFDYTWSEIDDLLVDVTAEVYGLKVRDTALLSEDIDTRFVKLGYGLVDRGDIFFRLGGADVESSDTGFAWGLGGRGTVVESERLDWGLLGQVNWFSTEYTQIIRGEMGGPALYRENFSYMVVQVAFGPVYKGDGFSVYGGPFLSWLRVDGDITVSAVSSSTKGDIEVEADVEGGGYVGLSVDVRTNFSINAEYQLAEHYRAFTCGLTWRF